MAELDPLDFHGLRADIEAATMLPEFAQVARRARRMRARARLATLTAVLAIVALLVPVGVIASLDRGGTTAGPVSGPDGDSPVQIGLQTPSVAPDPTASTTPHATVVAAAGINVDYVYALIDVCLANSCNLQLSRVVSGQGANGSGPARIGLLRKQPTDYLGRFQLTALGDTSLVVSAVGSDGDRVYQRVELGSISDDPDPRSSSTLAKTGDRAGVIDTSGTLQALDDKTSQLRTVPVQPPLRQLVAAGSVAPANGLWVTGVNAVTGQLGVSVSRDAGAHWTTVGLGVQPGAQAPALASCDGHTGYVLVRTADRTFALFQTTDGGAAWQQVPASLPWPVQTDANTGYGLVMRADGTLLAWLNTSPATVYAQSTDGGKHFTNVAGPGGPVIQVSDGYASFGPTPKLSKDGLNWADAVLPYLPVSS